MSQNIALLIKNGYNHTEVIKVKISKVFLRGVGPFQNKKLLYLSLDDQRVLIRGLSGSGKSTLLQVISYLWCKAGNYSLLPPFEMEENGFIAMYLVNYLNENWFIFEGGLSDEEKEEMIRECPDATWVNVSQKENLPKDVNGQEPNILLYDNEISKYGTTLEDSWFFTDDDIKKIVTDRQGAPNVQFQKAALHLKKVLSGKQLLLENNNRWVVQLENRQEKNMPFHTLSLGEKSLFYLYVGIYVYLKENGVLLLDEPAFHLHPEQVISSLAGIEGICREKNAQLLIVSHNQQAWERYEALGLIIDLSPSLALEGNLDDNDE